MVKMLNNNEMKMNRDELNLVVSMKINRCRSCYDVCKLLDDVREHERGLM